VRIDLQLPGDIDVYSLLISTVAPRPIGWVSTLSSANVRNLAPFSYFGIVSHKPAILYISVGRRNGELKDTSRNLLETQEAVVHLADRKLAEAMVSTGSDVGPNVDEFSIAGLASVKSDVVRPERLRDGAIAYECRVYRHIEVGTGPTDLFLLEALVAHIQDGLLGGSEPPARKIGLLGRLGASDYAVITETLSIRRAKS
jgi:flavin reductase (DIM6/NTAB) family NADH-FMN oxidoreductase RutF